MIKQIGLPLRGRPILLITRMITDRIGLHSVLLPLLIQDAWPQLFKTWIALYMGQIISDGFVLIWGTPFLLHYPLDRPLFSG